MNDELLFYISSCKQDKHKTVFKVENSCMRMNWISMKIRVWIVLHINSWNLIHGCTVLFILETGYLHSNGITFMKEFGAKLHRPFFECTFNLLELLLLLTDYYAKILSFVNNSQCYQQFSVTYINMTHFVSWNIKSMQNSAVFSILFTFLTLCSFWSRGVAFTIQNFFSSHDFTSYSGTYLLSSVWIPE